MLQISSPQQLRIIIYIYQIRYGQNYYGYFRSTFFENRYNEHFSLGLDTEYYYDLEEKAMDFAFGLYLRYGLMPK